VIPLDYEVKCCYRYKFINVPELNCHVVEVTVYIAGK
jgi:hypothetical protein